MSSSTGGRRIIRRWSGPARRRPLSLSVRRSAMMQLAAAMLIVLVSLPAAAQQQREKVMIWGAGLTSCGEFLKIVADNPRSEVTFGQWLHGYISGRNYADRGVVDYAASLERAALMAWITNHCKNNLLDSFLDATEALILELQARGRIERR